MSDDSPTTVPAETPAPRRRRAAGRPAGPPAPVEAPSTSTAVEPEPAPAAEAPAKTTKAAKAPAKAAKAPAKSATKAAKAPAKTAKAPARSTKAAKAAAAVDTEAPAASEPTTAEAPRAEAPPARRSRSRAATGVPAFSAPVDPTAAAAPEPAAASTAGLLLFQAPSVEAAPSRGRKAAAPRTRKGAAQVEEPVTELPEEELEEIEAEIETELEASAEAEAENDSDDSDESGATARRRRRRGGRGRRRRTASDAEGDDTDSEDEAEGGSGADSEAAGSGDAGAADEDRAESDDDSDDEGGAAGSSRRRRRRRRRGGDSDGAENDPPQTVTRVREPRSRSAASEVTSVKGSTRLEAKKQRRREGREAGRRRPSILTEAEFLARREAVDRVMIVRQREDRTQIAVLEDGVLVEHYVNRSTGGSMIGNVYLGKVQNVLPSMEAAFVDVGRGRNAVLYAGEVNWDAAGMEGQPKRIEAALKSGDTILVQVSKDPLGHKGARLTGQISLPGRFLVYVPEGSMTGISRKLPDTERARLKSILREVVPEGAGVIVRTAAEGASEEELRRDVERLTMQWADIQSKAAAAGVNGGPTLLHGEPDLAIKVVRDIFNEDFGTLVVEGDNAWHDIESYVTGVAPDLADRLQKWVGPGDLFTEYRVDEQLAKALDRKVWLPSGGSLVIDRTEAMTVVDVNTGKFTGQGGNLEETVTKNNLEAAEEIVRQLRLRDIGGIIVVDFIDMVLENNRDLVLRRLIECLGRDRTKHQVAEVTSLGLVQMTRKRIGQGLLEVFSEPCEACQGRGYHVHSEPVVAKAAASETEGPAVRSGRRRKGADAEPVEDTDTGKGRARKRGAKPTGSSGAPEVAVKAVDPAASAAMEKIHAAAAKRAADAAAAEASGEAPVRTDAASQAAAGSVEAPTEAVEAPVAPARRARGTRKAARPAGPATATDAASAGSGPVGASPDVTGATAE